MQPGKLYAIGTGPGAADLLTVRAARILAGLDVLYAPAGKKGGDSLALTIVREYLGKQVAIKERHFPMSGDVGEKSAVWDGVAAEISEDVTLGRQVAFITLGDSMLFSTWVFLLARLQGKVPLEVIPGISSFSCIAARAQFPLAMETQSLAVVSCTAGTDVINKALLEHECVVLMKVYGRFKEVKTLLKKQKLLSHALLMANASMDSEVCYRALDNVNEEEKLPYFSTILVNKAWQN